MTTRGATSPDEAYRITNDNRLVIADVLAGLTPAQWEAPSLCAGWSVRVLAGHVLTPLLTGMKPGPTLATMIRFRGDTDRAMDHHAREFSDRPADEIVALIREHAGDRLSLPILGPYGQLADSFIHLLDLTRALGIPDPLPPERWVHALDFLASGRARIGFVPKGRLDGLRLAATDTDWSHGDGAEVRGPGASLALAMTGRPNGLADLDGEGVELLPARIGG